MQLSNRLQLERADVVITPAVGDHLASDFTELDSIIYQGRVAAEKVIGVIDSVYNNRIAMRSNAITSQPPPTDTGRVIPAQTDDPVIGKKPYYFNSLLLVSNVKFTGTSQIPDSVLITPFGDLLGHFVTPVQINRACEQLVWIYRNADLGLARLENVSYDSVNAVLDINIDEGSISDISLSGNVVARSFLVRREFPLNTNSLFTTSRAIEGINNIYSTGLFSQVLLSTSFTPTPDLTIDVAEKSSRLLRFGLRADNERNGQLFSSLSDEDLFGSGTRAGISFAGGLRNRLVEAFVGTTRILNTDLTYNFTAFTGFQDVNVYTDQPVAGNSTVWNLESDGGYRIVRNGYEISIGTQIRRFGMVDAALDYGWDRIKPLQNSSESFSSRIVSLRVGSFVDTRDKAAFSRSGILSNIYFETALKGLNSETPFSKILFDYETYQTAFSIFTFKQHYEFGFGDATLPLSRQFSIGGQDLFYGLREDALRGKQVILASAELRVRLPIKIFFDTYLSGRFDLGDVWAESIAQQQNIVLRTLKQGIGGSLGFDTPMGPIVFSVGKAFYPGKTEKIQTLSTPWTFYFTIGVEIPKVTSYQ